MAYQELSKLTAEIVLPEPVALPGEYVDVVVRCRVLQMIQTPGNTVTSVVSDGQFQVKVIPKSCDVVLNSMRDGKYCV